MFEVIGLENFECFRGMRMDLIGRDGQPLMHMAIMESSGSGKGNMVCTYLFAHDLGEAAYHLESDHSGRIVHEELTFADDTDLWTLLEADVPDNRFMISCMVSHDPDTVDSIIARTRSTCGSGTLLSSVMMEYLECDACISREMSSVLDSIRGMFEGSAYPCPDDSCPLDIPEGADGRVDAPGDALTSFLVCIDPSIGRRLSEGSGREA